MGAGAEVSCIQVGVWGGVRSCCSFYGTAEVSAHQLVLGTASHQCSDLHHSLVPKSQSIISWGAISVACITQRAAGKEMYPGHSPLQNGLLEYIPVPSE